MGIHYPKSTGEFLAWFGCDADFPDYLEWLRWPDGFVCPACAQTGGWRLGDGRFWCSGCGSRTRSLEIGGGLGGGVESAIVGESADLEDVMRTGG